MKNTFCENNLAQLRCMPHADRYEKMKTDWGGMFDAFSRIDQVQNSNTYSSTLVTDFLVAGTVTKLQHKLAPLGVFMRKFSADPMKPRSKGQLKYASLATASSGNAQGKNLTNFEDGDTTVTAVEIAVDQYTRPFNVSNSDLQGGLQMDNLVEINTAKFADIIMAVAMAPITTSIFSVNTPLTVGLASFDMGDLTSAWGLLKKAPVKNAILDGEYFARILNQPGYFQATGTESGSAWKRFGWDYVGCCTAWDGAGANTHGFCCAPQAIGAIAGLPIAAPISDHALTRTDFVLPGLELSVAMHSWFSLQTRTGWASLDCMFGAKEMDTSAGVLIKSA